MQLTERGFELSVYSGELTTETIIKSGKQIRSAFPDLPEGFYDVLTDRITDLKFSDARLKAAVNYVIDNCHYPRPTIADFISYDKRIKLFTHREMMELAESWGRRIWDDYMMINHPNVPGKKLWVSITDVQLYNIQFD